MEMADYPTRYFGDFRLCAAEGERLQMRLRRLAMGLELLELGIWRSAFDKTLKEMCFPSDGFGLTACVAHSQEDLANLAPRASCSSLP